MDLGKNIDLYEILLESFDNPLFETSNNLLSDFAWDGALFSLQDVVEDLVGPIWSLIFISIKNKT
jgi:hypothetical protein